MPTQTMTAASCPPPPTLRFDRREFDRWPAEGAATAFELASGSFGRIHALRMRDFSDHGMAAVSDTVITPGTTVSIGFQAPGCLARRGVVLRCLPCGHGYEIAVGYDQRLAA
jgi:hypothetical protein